MVEAGHNKCKSWSKTIQKLISIGRKASRSPPHNDFDSTRPSDPFYVSELLICCHLEQGDILVKPVYYAEIYNPSNSLWSGDILHQKAINSGQSSSKALHLFSFLSIAIIYSISTPNPLLLPKQKHSSNGRNTCKQEPRILAVSAAQLYLARYEHNRY